MCGDFFEVFGNQVLIARSDFREGNAGALAAHGVYNFAFASDVRKIIHEPEHDPDLCTLVDFQGGKDQASASADLLDATTERF